MTYRSDSDAAHHRIAALEAENESLRKKTELALVPHQTRSSIQGLVGNSEVSNYSVRPSLFADEQQHALELFDSTWGEGRPSTKNSCFYVTRSYGLATISIAVESDGEHAIALRSNAELRKARAVTYLAATVASPFATWVAAQTVVDLSPLASRILRALYYRLGAGPTELLMFGSGMAAFLLAARWWNGRREKAIDRKMARMHHRWLSTARAQETRLERALPEGPGRAPQASEVPER